MGQLFSCTSVLLQNLEIQRTVYLNMFDLMKKLYILDMFKKIPAHQLTNRATISGTYYQYRLDALSPKQNWSGSTGLLLSMFVKLYKP